MEVFNQLGAKEIRHKEAKKFTVLRNSSGIVKFKEIDADYSFSKNKKLSNQFLH